MLLIKKLERISVVLLAILTSSVAYADEPNEPKNQSSAAGEGSNSGGGGGMKATLNGLLPKTIYQRITFDFTDSDVPKPFVSKSSCRVFWTCYQTPEKVVVELGYRVTPSANSALTLTSARAHYFRKGKSYEFKKEVYNRDPESIPLHHQYDFKTLGYKKGKLDERLTSTEPQNFFWPFWLGSRRDFRPTNGGGGSQQIWVDGVLMTQPQFSEKLARIQSILVSQADLNDMTDAKSIYEDLGLLNKLHWALKDEELVRTDFPATPLALLDTMNSNASAFLALAQSAVSQDGTCDQVEYAQLVNQLEAWKIGSGAYFSKIGEDSGISADEKLAAFGIRQKLRTDIKMSAGRFCEPQSPISKVDLILND